MSYSYCNHDSNRKLKKLKEKSISLKNIGIERIFGIGIDAAHKWYRSRVRKTWKSIVTRPVFDENLILLKRWKSLVGPGGSFLSLTNKICSTEPSQNYCDRYGDENDFRLMQFCHFTPVKSP